MLSTPKAKVSLPIAIAFFNVSLVVAPVPIAICFVELAREPLPTAIAFCFLACALFPTATAPVAPFATLPPIAAKELVAPVPIVV